MSMDDCFIPLHSPLSEPCLSQLDLDESKVRGGGGSEQGEEGGANRRTLQILNRPVAVPLRRLPRPLGPLPKLPAGSPSLYTENLPEEPNQHRPQAAPVSKGRSRAGWLSKERSTPEGYNREEHASMFKYPFTQPATTGYDSSSDSDWETPAIRQRKPLEVRNACRERRVALREKAARHHAEVALRKYNRANNTKFELVEVRVISIFFEFGGGCIHYNFTAKEPDGHLSADAGITKLFFSEVDPRFRDENDVLLCCIVGENDAGHCYGCEDYKPVVHPSSQAYGGGSSTFIEFPRSDGDSTDSD